MVYFYHSNRVNWAINEAGEMIDTGLLMDELEALLPKLDFLGCKRIYCASGIYQATYQGFVAPAIAVFNYALP